jgi:hypothetical protein
VSNAVGTSGVVTAIGAGTTTVRAQLAGQEGTASITVTGMMAAQISVAPVAATARVGQQVQFTASLIRSNGTSQNITGMAMWTSSNPMVAPLGGFGPGGASRASCQAPGTTTITATFMGLTDSTILTCTPPRMLTDLQVTPFAVSLTTGQTVQFQATAIYDDGSTQNVTGMTTWSSSNQMVADVRNMGGMGGRGQTTALSAGEATITGTYMGMSASGTVTVTAGVLTGLQVTPINATLPKGASQQYQAIGLYSDNTTRTLTGMAVWDSSTGAAGVSNAGGSRGLVTALVAGTTQISATFGGFTGSTTLTVTSATVTQIQVTPTNPLIPLSLTQPFQATAIYSDFTAQNVTAMSVWTSSNPMVAQVSNAGGSRGQATGLAMGSTTITATFMGVMGSSVLTVGAAIQQLVVTPAMVSTPVGVRFTFQATATLADGTVRDVTALSTWVSSDDTVVAISNAGGSRGQATALKPGTVKIVATAAGVSGGSGYTVGAQTLTSIAVTPAMSSVGVGKATSYVATGTYSDNSTYELTADVTWISTMPGIAAVSNAANKGLVTGLAVGTTNIEAHFQGLTGSTSLNVTP